MDKGAVAASLPQITRLVTQALDFRRVHAFGSDPKVRASATMVDTEVSAAMVSLVMKLSEVELRPLFLDLCEWKASGGGGYEESATVLSALDRRLSFYRVLDGLASALRSIFTPYLAHVMTDCCQDLQAASALAQQPDQESADAGERGDSVTKRRRSSSKTGGGAAVVVMVVDVTSSASKLRWRRSAAACLVLSILQRCFQYDRGGFVDKSRFDVLMPAIVSQLECGAGYLAASPESEFAATLSSGRDCVSVVDSTYDGEVSACRRHAEELVGPCLAMLAAASAKDALWKALVNAVLMKTRSGKVGVRVAALVSLRHCFEVVGEEFLALLPECLPFLSELLEDGHSEVEGECRQLVKYIESILGESIETYLS